MILWPQPRPDQIKARLEEADAIIQLYQLRLYNSKVKAGQDDLRLRQLRTTCKTLKDCGVVAQRVITEAENNLKLLQEDSKKKDVEEAEAELNIAKARRNLIKVGVWPSYPKN